MSLHQLSYTMNLSAPKGKPHPRILLNSLLPFTRSVPSPDNLLNATIPLFIFAATQLSSLPPFSPLTADTAGELDKQAGYLQTLRGLKKTLKARLQQIQASIQQLSMTSRDVGNLDTEDEGSALYGGIGFTSSAPPLDFRIHPVAQNSHWLNFSVSEGEPSCCVFVETLCNTSF